MYVFEPVCILFDAAWIKKKKILNKFKHANKFLEVFLSSKMYSAQSFHPEKKNKTVQINH